MDLKEFGKLLKEERLRKGLNLSEVMEKTKISRVSLEAIEEGNRRALPHPVYARGFVKNYARFLGLDADKMANTMAQIYSSDEDSHKLEQVILKDVRKLPSVKSRFPLHFGVGVLILALIVLLIGLWHFRGPIQDGFFSFLEKAGYRGQPAWEDKPAMEMGAQDVPAQGLLDMPPFREHPVPEIDPASPLAVFFEDVHESPPLPDVPDEEASDDTARMTAQAEPGAEARAVPAAITPEPETPAPRSGPQESPTLQQQPPASTPGPRTLEIRANQNCWLSAQADGGRVREAFLRADERLVVSFENSLELKLGNAGGVELFLDGRPWPFQGRVGEVLILQLP